jgi:DNA-binding transcriptional MocR family regulator
VVHWLREVPIGSISADDVILANGGQNAILLVLQTLLKGRKPTILVEELSYPGFSRAAELLRADVVPVAMDADGIIPEALEAAARQHEAQILCTSPEVHNPTLRFTPETRRKDIVSIARRLDLEILEDDCYRMNIAQAVSYRMLAPERAWYIGSISKMLTPALRLGYAVSPEGAAAKLRRSAEYSFFGLATPLTDLFSKLLPHPQMPQIKQNVIEETNRYIQSTVNILGGYDLTWRPDVLFLWLTLPEGWRASAFCQAAEAQGVRIRSAEDYTERNGTTRHAVRIAINAGVGLANFEAAIGRLRDLLDNPPERFGV